MPKLPCALREISCSLQALDASRSYATRMSFKQGQGQGNPVMRAGVWAGVMAVCCVGVAGASPARDAMTAVAKCAEISGTDERLQCFDAAAASVRTVLADADRQAEAARKQEEEGGGVLAWFGFTQDGPPVTKAEDFGIAPAKNTRPDAPKEITEISASVQEFAKTPLGKSIFILDNGQIWRQLDGDQTEVQHRSSSGPMNVRIEKAFMGSYSLFIEGTKKMVKVRRLK